MTRISVVTHTRWCGQPTRIVVGRDDNGNRWTVVADYERPGEDLDEIARRQVELLGDDAVMVP